MDPRIVNFSIPPVIKNLHKSSARMAPYWVAAALTALVSVLFAKMFTFSEDLAFRWNEQQPLLGFFFTPAAMLASMLLAHFIAPGAAGSGIPQMLAAVEVSEKEENPLLEKLLGLKMIFVKILGACICVAGGGISGREGPMLQISGGLFNAVRKIWPKIFKTEAPHPQSMILAGGAAGLASAFNTPLGGIVFAIEELAKVHINQIRTYVFHAVIFAGILAQAIMGNYLYFGQTQAAPLNVVEIVPLILAAAFIGILGAAFGKMVVAVFDLRAQMTLVKKVILTLILGLAVASIGYFFGKPALGTGRAVIVDLITHPDNAAPFYLGFIRGIGNFMTYAGGVVGGVFAPALSTGAALGSWLSGLGDNFNHQIWVLAGMTAFLTGITRTPFTSMILVLEMTDSHNVIICLMLAAIIAQSASKLVDPVSFYEHVSHRLIHGKPMNQPHR